MGENSGLRVKRIVVSEEENELFKNALGDVEPLAENNKLAIADPTRIKKVLGSSPSSLAVGEQAAQVNKAGRENDLATPEFITPVKPLEIIAFQCEGIQHGVYKKLKLGKYKVQASLDLHRRTAEQARHDVYDFIVDCTDDDVRNALIIHGKGLYQQSQALLKSCVNHWLRQMHQVLAIHSALPRDGGTGAVYILLRKKSPESCVEE